MPQKPSNHSETLLEFTKILNTSLDLEEILKCLLRSVMGYMLVGKGLVAIQATDETYKIALARGLTGLKVDSLFDKDSISKLGIYQIYPIGNSPSPIGYLGISSPPKKEITPKQKELLEALLGVAASNINNAITHKQVQLLNQELRQKNQELRAILEFSQELSSSIEPENILLLLTLTISGQWTIKKYAIATWKEPYAPILRQKGITIPSIDILKRTLVGLPNAIFVSDLEDSELKNSLREQGASLVFPICITNRETSVKSSKEIIGVMILGQRPKKTYTELELEFGSSLVAQAAIALQKAWYVREMVQRKETAAKLAAQKQADKVFFALVDILPGSILDDKYRLEDKIDSGGFGAIYRALHLGLKTYVAVKILRPMSSIDDSEHLERFRQEAIAASKINHPNAVTILDCGISKQGIAYIVMELLSGHSLAELLRKQGALSLLHCVRIISSVCSVLSQAHSMSMIHRDIKPENVFLHQRPEGEIVKVIDFGLAKIYATTSDGETSHLTQQGQVLGTPAYMSPERIHGEECDGQSDVYSVGIMLYEMLSGKLPFTFPDNSFFSVAMKHITDNPTPLREVNPELSVEIETVVMSALHKNPGKRPSAKELAKNFLDAATRSIKANIDSTSALQAYTKRVKRDTVFHQEDTDSLEQNKVTQNPVQQINTIKAIWQEDWSKRTKIEKIK